MTHLEVENSASDYLEGLLGPAQRTEIEAHLAECAACRGLLADVRHVVELCRKAEAVEPRPWLISRIMVATVGERKPTWRKRMAAYFRPMLQPRVAYPIAMTVFTFSLMVNAAGVNLRHMHLEDLNPRTWAERLNRQRHLTVARAEKFYYDLRVVVELESRFRQLGEQPQNQQEETPKPDVPGGGSSQGTPSGRAVALNHSAWDVVVATNDPVLPAAGAHAGVNGAGRSVVP